MTATSRTTNGKPAPATAADVLAHHRHLADAAVEDERHLNVQIQSIYDAAARRLCELSCSRRQITLAFRVAVAALRGEACADADAETEALLAEGHAAAAHDDTPPWEEVPGARFEDVPTAASAPRVSHDEARGVRPLSVGPRPAPIYACPHGARPDNGAVEAPAEGDAAGLRRWPEQEGPRQEEAPQKWPPRWGQPEAIGQAILEGQLTDEQREARAAYLEAAGAGGAVPCPVVVADEPDDSATSRTRVTHCPCCNTAHYVPRGAILACAICGAGLIEGGPPPAPASSEKA
jgi:hypothetical protein